MAPLSQHLFLRIFFAGIGLLFLVGGAWSLIKRRASQSWPQVPGRVVRTSVEVHKTRRTSYWPAIEYAYVFEGAKYLGTRFTFAQMRGSSRQEVEHFIAQYPPNRNVMVLVNPKKPDEAVLGSGSLRASLFIMAIGLIFVIVAIVSDFQ